jgi:hypothetical protein
MDMYLIVIGKTATGYSAHCPDVLGCAAVGMEEDGDPIPKPGGVKAYRAVMKDLDMDRYFLAHVQIDTSRFTSPGRT